MIASLPMYDWSETADANDRLWNGFRVALGYGPMQLTRGGDPWSHWLNPGLLLSQTCGYPYRARLYDKVTLVGAPVLDLPDCLPGQYYSVFVARRDDPRDDPRDFSDARLAYNEPLSQSGWAAPQNYAGSEGFSFANTMQSGAHRASAIAVSDGRADTAALDALSWKMMQRFDRFAASLKEVAQTPPTPALPYITSIDRDQEAIFSALSEAIANLEESDRDILGLKSVTYIPEQVYRAVPNPPLPPY